MTVRALKEVIVDVSTMLSHFGKREESTGRCSIIRKIKQMALANHGSPFPQLPGIPTLRLSFTYVCLIKFLPFHGNRISVIIQAHPELWTSNIIHVFPECEETKLLVFSVAFIPASVELTEVTMSLAGRRKACVCLSGCLQCSADCNTNLMPYVSTGTRAVKPQVTAQSSIRKQHFQEQRFLLLKSGPLWWHYIYLLIRGSFDLSANLKRQLRSLLTEDLLKMPN